MKGLTLTMEIVIIAIVLLVTALVIMTIFGGSIASFLGILNPWSAALMEQNLCNQRCAAWCQGHLGTSEIGWGDSNFGKVQTQSGEQSCATIMSGISEKCLCRTIVSNTCSLRCLPGDTAKTETGTCTGGKKCKVTCPPSIPAGGVDQTGQCA